MKRSSHTDISAHWSGRIFTFWLGPADLSPRRLESLQSLVNSQCAIHLVTKETLESFASAERPFHEAFQYLSAVHQSDYLRAYFMHHFGGGYTDVKRCDASWRPAFEAMESRETLAAGYREVPGGLARFHRSKIGGQGFFLSRPASTLELALRYRWTRINRRRLIGNGAFIFRPGTEMTRRWLELVEQRLDLLLPRLRQHPARYPREVPAVDFGTGPSQYPVPWSFLLGDILAPLSLQYHRRILQLVPAPDFTDYR
ncbi:hypothetical protein AB2N04_09030 [Nitratireductor sp. GISD-1A_MAKvit]|uniref:hypothetical protein n=1 Tax=Nitratireductor sp. GISD-1A_MAKvit TaxID=3234198 RepID=UPI003466EF90